MSATGCQFLCIICGFSMHKKRKFLFDGGGIFFPRLTKPRRFQKPSRFYPRRIINFVSSVFYAEYLRKNPPTAAPDCHPGGNFLPGIALRCHAHEILLGKSAIHPAGRYAPWLAVCALHPAAAAGASAVPLGMENYILGFCTIFSSLRNFLCRTKVVSKPK